MSRMAHSVLLSLLRRGAVESCGCLATELGVQKQTQTPSQPSRLPWKQLCHGYLCLALESLSEWLPQSTLEVMGPA